MVQNQTYLNVADNTGAKKVMCIRILGSKKKEGHVGDIIVCVVKQAIPNMIIKKSNIVKGVIVRTVKKINRKDGTWISFNENAIVILNTDKNPKGTRIFGPIPKEIREKKFMKIISLANNVI
jgi:large subunit ribosomal protein L14